MRTILLAFVATALAAAEPVAVVSGVTVVSDRVADVSSFDAWRAATIGDAKDDAAKALATARSVVAFAHFDPPVNEYAAFDGPAMRDAIKLFNVYGYGSDATSLAVLQLWRGLGYEARASTVNKWGCVPEVSYGGGWHAYDPTMIAWFAAPDGHIAGVDEIAKDVQAWLAQHPDLKGDAPKLKAFLAEHGVKDGPEVLRGGLTYDQRGNFWFNYFGWYTAMLLYDGSNNTPFRYEEPYDLGYRVDNQLRRGQRLTWRWSNTGKHVNMAGDGGAPEVLGATVGSGALYYTPALGDLANGRVGNGEDRWDVPLDDALAGAAISVENAAFAGGVWRAKDPAKPSVIVLRRPSSYVFLGGALAVDGAFASGDGLAVAYSENHGRAWRDLGAARADGAATIAIPSLRRYDYRLRLTLTPGCAVKLLTITDDIQQSQRALPALGEGETKLVFRAGPDEGTITIEPCGPAGKGKGVTADDYGIELKGFAPIADWGPLIANADAPTVTVPIETPGDLVRLRFGCCYRANLASEAWHYEASFDDGATWVDAGAATGPRRIAEQWVAFDHVPPHARRALVRYRGVSHGSLLIFRLRVDADYREPAGGFAPIRATYRWSEAGEEKRDAHLAHATSDAWTIRCGAKPTMIDLVLERADGAKP